MVSHLSTDCETGSWSRFNLESASYICHMVNDMRKNAGFPMEDVVILTTYGQQRGLINSILMCMAIKLGISHNALPKVFIVDSFQSMEAKMEILDMVVTNELGFVDNENRTNVACTRAMLVLIIITSKLTKPLSTDVDFGGKKKATRDIDDLTKVSRRFSVIDGEW